MQTQDILDVTHQLEEKGMTRPQAETISRTLAAAIEPLATKKDLATAIEPLATRQELADAIKPLATRQELADAIKPFATKQELADAIKPLATRQDLAMVEERLSKDMVIMFEKTNSRIESTKVWLLGGLLALALSIGAYALQVAAAPAPAGEPDLEAGQSNPQPSEIEQSAVPDPTD